VMKERRADPLNPAGPLGHQRVAQPGARAPLPDVLGRAPRLRQAPLTEQLTQPPGVRPVGLRAALAPPQRAGLHRLGQMRERAGPLQRPAHEQPARARLNRNMHDPAPEPPHPLLDRRRARIELTAPHLAAHRIQGVERDLPTMHVEPRDDRSGSDTPTRTAHTPPSARCHARPMPYRHPRSVPPSFE
jgi:hypothetical protein